jgi:hypothetical protein
MYITPNMKIESVRHNPLLRTLDSKRCITKSRPLIAYSAVLTRLDWIKDLLTVETMTFP